MPVSPAQLQALLQRHVPVLRYDSQEPYWADSAAIWTDNPGNVLRRASGEILASATPSSSEQTLSLSLLQAAAYPDASPVRSTDVIADPGHDYVAQARSMHSRPGYANRVYGHVATGSDDRYWLAYWFFYFYNDYNLVGPLFPAGLHEGDWEMIQLRLAADASGPDLAVYAQHTHAESRAWGDVEKLGAQPVVYPARGSHASYFGVGPHWTGVWWDHADGRQPAAPLQLEVISDDDPEQAWVLWPGMWGGTLPKPGLDRPLEDSSPRGPVGHAQWRDPTALLQNVKSYLTMQAARPALPAAPTVVASRAGAQLDLKWTSSVPAAALIVSVSPTGACPELYRVAVSGDEGTAVIGAGLRPEQPYEVHVSVADADGRASAATHTSLPVSA